MSYRTVHFGKFDARHCGKGGTHRFSTDENEVNCPKCMARDRLELTPRGASMVKAIEEGRLAEYLEGEDGR